MIDARHNEHTVIFSKNISKKECIDTGMALVLVCLLAGWFSGNRNWLAGAMLLLVVNMTWPTIYTWAAMVWLGFSQLLGAVMSKVVLSLVFFIVVTPLALFRKALGHDPMALNAWKNGTHSVFQTRDHTYTPEEIELPF